MCERRGEDGRLVEQWKGQRRAVGQHVRGQWGRGGRSHLVEGEARLVAVKWVVRRWCAQTCEDKIVPLKNLKLTISQ